MYRCNSLDDLSPVTGKPYGVSCITQRGSEDACGPSGVWFEEKQTLSVDTTSDALDVPSVGTTPLEELLTPSPEFDNPAIYDVLAIMFPDPEGPMVTIYASGPSFEAVPVGGHIITAAIFAEMKELDLVLGWDQQTGEVMLGIHQGAKVREALTDELARRKGMEEEEDEPIF
jgi:hypothetical protein